MGSANSIEEWLEIIDENVMINNIAKDDKFIKNIIEYKYFDLLARLYKRNKIKVLDYLLEEIKKEIIFYNNKNVILIMNIFEFIRIFSHYDINESEIFNILVKNRNIIYNLSILMKYIDKNIILDYDRRFEKNILDGLNIEQVYGILQYTLTNLLEFNIIYNLDYKDIDNCIIDILNYKYDNNQIVVINYSKLVNYLSKIKDIKILENLFDNYYNYGSPKINAIYDIIFNNKVLYNVIIDKYLINNDKENIQELKMKEMKQINIKEQNLLRIKKYLKNKNDFELLLLKCLESNNLELLDCFDLNDKNINSIIENYISEKNIFINKINIKK